MENTRTENVQSLNPQLVIDGKIVKPAPPKMRVWREFLAFSEKDAFKINKALNTSCFSGIIKCAICGASYHRSRYHRKTVRWVCSSKKHHGKKPCGAKDIREEVLKQLCTEALGLKDFDDKVFAGQVEKIIVRGTTLEIHFSDGTTTNKEWRILRPGEWWTPQRRKLWLEYYHLGASKGTGIGFVEFIIRRNKENGKTNNGDTRNES